MPAPAKWTRPEDLVGSTLGDRYRLIRLLGQGGMGAVYEGVHQKIDKRLAIKVLDPRLAAEDRQKSRFLREARSAAKIRSRHVVDITDFGDEPVAYFAMELLRGSDLSQLLHECGPLPWARAKKLLMQICAGLHAAHVEGIVHRDIKPSNIFVEQDEHGGDFVKLLDFGIAKLTEASGAEKGITNTNEAMGTLAYMSPEQALGVAVDLRTDIYALGIVIFQVLTGEVPFDGTSQFQVMEKHVRAAPPPLRDLLPSAPADLEAAILRCMAKEPPDRFQSVEDLAAVLDGILEATGAPSARVPSPPSGPSPRVPAPQAPEKTMFEPVFEIGEDGELQAEPSPGTINHPTEPIDNLRVAGRSNVDSTLMLPGPEPAEPDLVDAPTPRSQVVDEVPRKPSGAAAKVHQPRSSTPPEDFTIIGRSGLSGTQLAVRVVAGGLLAMLAGGGLALWLTADGDVETHSDTVTAAADRPKAGPPPGEAGRAVESPTQVEANALVIGEALEEPAVDVEPEPDVEVPPEPKSPTPAAPEAAPPRPKNPAPAEPEQSKPKSKPQAAKPKGDDALIRSAKRKALKRCGQQVKGSVASFQVMSSGSLVLAKVTPANTCAQSILNGIDFPPRDKPVKKTFTF